MDMTARGLIEARLRLINERQDIGVEAIAGMRGDPHLARAFDVTPYEMVEMETAKVACADLFYVSAPMTEVACAAARTLPRFAADAQDFPAKVGFIYFDGGFGVEWDSRPVRVHAISWMLLDWGAAVAFYIDKVSARSLVGEGKVPALRSFIGLTTRGDGLWCNDITRSAIAFNEGVGDDEAAELANGLVAGGVSAPGIHVLRSALLLMQQPLAEVADEMPSRASSKRLQRAGLESKPIRVIELRRPKHASSGTGDSGREYQHQWIVRGHWRQQWYPAREVHRPVWIAPHIKGPDGAPLIGGEKVYALKR